MDAHGAPWRVLSLFPALGHLASGWVSGALNPHPAAPGLELGQGCHLEPGLGGGGCPNFCLCHVG